MLDYKQIEIETREKFRESLQMDYGQEFRAIRFHVLPEEENSIRLQLVEDGNGDFIPCQISGIYTVQQIQKKQAQFVEKYQGYDDLGKTYNFEPYKIGYLKTSERTLVERDIFHTILLDPENTFNVVQNFLKSPRHLESFIKKAFNEMSVENVIEICGFESREELVDSMVGEIVSTPEGLRDLKQGMINKSEKDFTLLTPEVIQQKLDLYYQSNPALDNEIIQQKITQIKADSAIFNNIKI